VPETIELDRLLAEWRITREGLIDLAILVGTDFNDGVKGIGPKKALKLVQAHGRIENMPDEIRNGIGAMDAVDDIRHIFLDPDVTDEFDLSQGEPDFAGITRFLCDEREFSHERVTAALERTFRERSLF
jgi:flap endonuclease-1